MSLDSTLDSLPDGVLNQPNLGPLLGKLAALRKITGESFAWNRRWRDKESYMRQITAIEREIEMEIPKAQEAFEKQEVERIKREAELKKKAEEMEQKLQEGLNNPINSLDM